MEHHHHYEPNRLLDAIAAALGTAGDKKLAAKLGLSPHVLAGLRNRRLPVTATMLLKMHEETGLPVESLRRLLGDRRHRLRVTGHGGAATKYRCRR